MTMESPSIVVAAERIESAALAADVGTNSNSRAAAVHKRSTLDVQATRFIVCGSINHLHHS